MDQKLIEAQLNTINEKLDRMEIQLTGNGDPGKGIIVRLDRLEQSEVRRGWMSKTALGVAITTLVGAIIKVVLKI